MVARPITTDPPSHRIWLGLLCLIMTLVLALLPSWATAQQQRIQVTASASVDNPEPAPNDAVIYTIRVKIQGAQMSLGNISAPALPQGLSSTELRSVGKSESFEIINGAISQSTDYRFVFQAHKEGEYSIPAQELIFQNQRIPVNAVKVKISRTPAPVDLPAELKDLVAPPSAPGNPELAKALNGGLFILPMLSSRKIYEGQQVILSYHLVWDPAQFQRAGLRTDTIFVEDLSVPSFSQFLKEVTHTPPRTVADGRRDRTFGNRTYAVTTLYEFALTPTKTGKLEIEPARLLMQIPLQRRGATPSALDPFANDPFFADDPIFGGLSSRMGAGQRVRLAANSPSLSIEVMPVPTAGRPANWNGAVGQFKIRAELDRTTATANQDIIRLDVTVEGQGDAAGLNPPQLSLGQGVRQLEDPKTAARTRRENDQPIQSKTFSYLLRAEQPGSITLPPVTLSVFDTKDAQFREIQSAPLSLDVLPGTNSNQAVTFAKAPDTTPADSQAIPTPQAAVPMPALRFLPNHAPRAQRWIPGPGAMALILICPPLLAFGFMRMVAHSDRKAAAYLAAHRPDWPTLLQQANLSLARPWPTSIQDLAQIIRKDLSALLDVQSAHPTAQELNDALEARFGSDDQLEQRQKALRLILEVADALRYAAPGTPPPAEDWSKLVKTLFAPPNSSGGSRHA